MSDKPIRVIVVEDQLLVRRGLIELLEPESSIEIVGEAQDGVEALREIARLQPDVALVDAQMPRMDGVELIQRLTAYTSPVAAIILTTFDDDAYIFGGLKAGAKGYLLKDTTPDDLVAAIKKVSRGETVLGSPIATRLISELKRDAERSVLEETDTLSKREAEIAKLIGRGATNAEIASALYLSEGTVKNNVSKILQKLGLRDRTQVALYTVKRWPTDSSG